MSLKATKEHLTQLLADADISVIALTGKWGTGKSYMWNEVKAASEDPKIAGALFASLFGLSTIEQVKIKLIQGTIPALKASTKSAIKAGVKVLEGVHKGFGALNDLGLVVAPSMLKGKLIVLDDIERKHEKLNIEEVLGFIDEFTQQYGSRFILILNSDQLKDRAMWNTLREKVVDHELCLKTTPSEAFDIAIGLTPSYYSGRIREVVETCGLSNIRIISKVIKAVNRILGDRNDLKEAVLSRVIPSTVLLSAIHYKGIEDGPDFDFVLGQGNDIEEMIAAHEDEKGKVTEDTKRKGKWRLLLRELGILTSDEFEVLVADFLQSGLFDVSSVATIIDRYVTEDDLTTARNDCNEFLQRMVWEHTLTEAELLLEGTKLAENSHLLDAYKVTALHESLSELQDGKVIADLAIDRWIKAFREKNLTGVDLDNFFHRKVHPRVEEEFNAINLRSQTSTTALDACLHIIKSSGWGMREEAVLKSATVQDMEQIIRTCSTSDLQLFMRRMLEMCTDKQSYINHFGTAMDNFVHACRNIANDPNANRLGKLIKLLFADSKLEDGLKSKDSELAS
ncbi:KAP family NTPase [Geomonas subterranea]|uniref:KAP family NTPase n=1 Tax=Geomonas subterranea TaxID=2847989 RepID=A0ABX8LBX4_9BACT|nr:P-loop NTPase fold protein [Geomonas subterranea]QXE89177.1 KAP family NTPase [Geomonas subterranea]QXM08707.1 KAP family NTPase [Geomonas subterranea]